MSHAVITHGGLPNGSAARTTSQAKPQMSEASDSAPYRPATTRTRGTPPPTSRPADHSTTLSEVEKLRRAKQLIMDNQVPFYLSGAATAQALEALYVPHKPNPVERSSQQASLEPGEAVREDLRATMSTVTNPVSSSGPAGEHDMPAQRVDSQKPDPEEHEAVAWGSYSAAAGTSTPQTHPSLGTSTTMVEHGGAMDVDLEDIKPIIHVAPYLPSKTPHAEPETKDPKDAVDIKQILHDPNNLAKIPIEHTQRDNRPRPSIGSDTVAQPTTSDDAKPTDGLVNGSSISAASSLNRDLNRQTSDALPRPFNEGEWDSRYTRPPEIALRAREALLRSSRPRPREDTPNDMYVCFTYCVGLYSSV